MARLWPLAASLPLVLASGLAACGGGAGAPGGGGSSGNGGGGNGGSGGDGPAASFGDMHSGQFNLGPVDWSESQWHNACGPYTADLEQLESRDELLAGLADGWAADGGLCDACVRITVASSQRSVVARVVTQGPNDIDLSPAAFAALDTSGVRDMSWQLVGCPDGGKIQYQFQTGANVWWTSLWVRDARLPVTKVEVKSANHADWFALSRNSDGTLDDGGGFGAGSFALRVTAVDGQTVTDTFPGFQPGAVLSSAGQFD